MIRPKTGAERKRVWITAHSPARLLTADKLAIDCAGGNLEVQIVDADDDVELAGALIDQTDVDAGTGQRAEDGAPGFPDRGVPQNL